MEEVRMEINTKAIELVGGSHPTPPDSELRMLNLADLKQAFSHVDPKFIWKILMVHQVSAWYLPVVGLTLFHRISPQKVGGRLHSPVSVYVGTNMGNLMADVSFMTATDPLLRIVEVLPGITNVSAYMDDIAAAASLHGSLMFQRALKFYGNWADHDQISHMFWIWRLVWSDRHVVRSVPWAFDT